MPEQPGMTVVICDGHRCRALQSRVRTSDADGGALLDTLRRTVRATPYAILIRSGCLGACAKAPVVLVSRRGGPGGARIFGPVEQPGQVRDVVAAVRTCA